VLLPGRTDAVRETDTLGNVNKWPNKFLMLIYSGCDSLHGNSAASERENMIMSIYYLPDQGLVVTVPARRPNPKGLVRCNHRSCFEPGRTVIAWDSLSDTSSRGCLLRRWKHCLDFVSGTMHWGVYPVTSVLKVVGANL
jgi:hypothetical protein